MPALANDQIAKLLGLPPKAIQLEVESVIEASCLKIETKLGLSKPLTRPTVVYDLVGTTAGEAYNSNKIRLNLPALLNQDPDIQKYMFNQTIPHEVAHIAEFQLYGKAGHGWRWRNLMYALDRPANRTHSLPLPKARVHKQYTWYCKCGPRTLKTTRHKRALRGLTTYHCTTCGALLQREAYSDNST